MAKSKERILAQKMRSEGKSISNISQELSVSRSSVSTWCRDITLTMKQKKQLRDQMIKGGHKGRMLGAQRNKDLKKSRIQKCRLQAQRDLALITDRDLFILGIGLYWGEGSKNNGVRFCNSDPAIIKVMMQWFRENIKLSEDRFMMYININDIHKERIDDVIDYWSRITMIPVGQFRSPTFIHAQNKKIYTNLSDHYGTLSIRISKSYELMYQILAWMKVLGYKAG